MNRLKQLRQASGLTQAKLAQIIDVHQTAISQWETGKTNLGMLPAMQLSQFFNVSTAYILGYSDEPTPKRIEN